MQANENKDENDDPYTRNGDIEGDKQSDIQSPIDPKALSK